MLEYYLIERQFTADDWHWWREFKDEKEAIGYMNKCRNLLPNDVFRLVYVKKTVLEV